MNRPEIDETAQTIWNWVIALLPDHVAATISDGRRQIAQLLYRDLLRAEASEVAGGLRATSVTETCIACGRPTIRQIVLSALTAKPLCNACFKTIRATPAGRIDEAAGL